VTRHSDLTPPALGELISALPKAELHIHMEGAIPPATVVELAARYGDTVSEPEVAARYATRDFAAFIEAYKWLTSYLRAPADYALVAAHLAEQLLAQNVVYAEVTLSVGVMLLRKQDPAANFRAIREATAAFQPRGLRIQWIFDAVRQFGPAPALEVARVAASLLEEGVVAFGMGGDELAIPTADFRGVYEFARSSGLRLLVHAGEIGGPDSVREAVTILGVDRVGHGIAAFRDPALVEMLAEKSIPLELCPSSNLRTGALARQLSVASPTMRDHPAPVLFRAGVPVTISTDDPAMFETDLGREYATLLEMGMSAVEIVRVAENSFAAVFLPVKEKTILCDQFRARTKSLGLL
jgi:adenosine deaminase